MTGEASTTGDFTAAVRRCLLAATVLHDLDLRWDPAPGSAMPDVHLLGPGGTSDARAGLTVTGHCLSGVLAGARPDSPEGMGRVATWLVARWHLERIPSTDRAAAVRVVGLPDGHVLHPGPAWVRRRVPSGALTLGLGLLGDGADGAAPLAPADLLGGTAAMAVPAAPAPVPLPPGVLEDAGLDPDDAWIVALRRLEELGVLAAARRRRRPRDAIRPMAEADVVTLLGSRTLRQALAGESGGLVGLVVPMRSRGWVSSSSLDPAFGPAAATATEAEHRGFVRPLLVTADEVVLVPPGGDPMRYLDGRSAGSATS